MSLDRIVDDFRQMDPNDPGAWPLAPKVVVLFFVFVAVLVAAWFVTWSGMKDDLANAQNEETTLKGQWVEKKRQAVNLEEYRTQLAEMDRQFGALLKQLPNKSEMENLIIDINTAGRGRGLQFDLWKPGAEMPRDFYAELPISVSITGNYHALGQFASDVAKQPRIVTLRDITLTPKDGGLLKFDATAVTYRYLDEDEVSKLKRAKSAEKK